MRKSVEFLIYLTGVAFFSWNYYKLKGALDFLPFFIFSCFYLVGVSKFATFLSQKMDTLIHRQRKKPQLDDS